jgi:hypothetical protein
MIFRYGHSFVNDYFLKNTILRSTQPIEGHIGTLYAYFNALNNRGRPWGVFLPIVLPWAIWRIRIKKEQSHVLPVIWFTVFITLMSLVQTKLHWYIIPLYPATSMLIAWGFNKVLGRNLKIVIPIFFVAALIYLSMMKRIFNLDYTPDTKKIALQVKEALHKDEKVFLCEVGDPAMRFYLGDVGELISAKGRLQNQNNINGYYMVFERQTFESIEQKPAIFIQNPAFIITKVTK